MNEKTFDYRNRTGRGPGRALRALSAVLPGVARVGAQIEPYADAWHSHNVEVLLRPGRRWVVLGDSLSLGIGASKYDAGWVGLLARQLAEYEPGLEVLNLSAGGARVRDVLEQQLPTLHAVGVREDDLVSVVVGANDFFGGRKGRAGLAGDFAKLVAAVPVGTVVSTLPQRTGSAEKANGHIERASARGQIVMADLRAAGLGTWRGRIASDFFHPNDAGYAAFAAAMKPILTARLVADA